MDLDNGKLGIDWKESQAVENEVAMIESPKGNPGSFHLYW